MHPRRRGGLGARPGVLRAGVEGGPGQVEPDGPAAVVVGLGLEPGQDAQRLGVALEPSARPAQLGQHPLAVVPVRRVAEVVRQRRGLHEVGVAAQGPGQVAGDLGHLERVGQPVADEVVGLRTHDLRLGRQPARGRGMDDPGAVALERPALGCRDTLRRLRHDALARRVVVPLLDIDPVHRGEPSASPRRRSSPADRSRGYRPAYTFGRGSHDFQSPGGPSGRRRHGRARAGDQRPGRSGAGQQAGQGTGQGGRRLHRLREGRRRAQGLHPTRRPPDRAPGPAGQGPREARQGERSLGSGG